MSALFGEHCGYDDDVFAYQSFCMAQAQQRNRKLKEEAERSKLKQISPDAQPEQTDAASEASASTYARLYRRMKQDEYISPKQVEKFMGVRSSRKKDSSMQTDQGVVKVRVDPRTLQRNDISSTVSKGSSTKFQRKISAKIACVACVVGIPSQSENSQGDVATAETRQDVATTGQDEVVVQTQEPWLGFTGPVSSLVESSATSKTPESRKQARKRVSFLSELVESHNQRIDDEEELEDQIAETSLLSCLDDAERWLGIRDDASATNDAATHASFTTSLGGSSRGPFSCS